MKTNTVNNELNNEVFTSEEFKAIEQEIVSRILSEIYCMTNFDMSYKEWRDQESCDTDRNQILSTYYTVDSNDYSLVTPWLSYNRDAKKQKIEKSEKPLRYVSQEKVIRLNNEYNRMTDNKVVNGAVIPNKKKVLLGELLDRIENVILNVSQMNIMLYKIGYVIRVASMDETYHIERNDGKYIACITKAMYDSFVSQGNIDFLKLKVNRKKFKLYHKPSPVILSDRELKRLEVSQKRALRDTKRIEKALQTYNSYTFARMTKVKSLEQFEEVVSHMRGEIQLEDDCDTVLQQVSYADSLTCDTLPMIYDRNGETVIHEGVLHLIDIMSDLDTVYDTVSRESLKKHGSTIARKGDTLIPIYVSPDKEERELPEDESVIRVTLNGKTVEKRHTNYRITNLKGKAKKKKTYDAASRWLKDNDPKRKTA